jgi:hypothetical protein
MKKEHSTTDNHPIGENLASVVTLYLNMEVVACSVT